jgi:hypothetical protein
LVANGRQSIISIHDGISAIHRLHPFLDKAIFAALLAWWLYMRVRSQLALKAPGGIAVTRFVSVY